MLKPVGIKVKFKYQCSMCGATRFVDSKQVGSKTTKRPRVACFACGNVDYVVPITGIYYSTGQPPKHDAITPPRRTKDVKLITTATDILKAQGYDRDIRLSVEAVFEINIKLGELVKKAIKHYDQSKTQ